jgi:4-hydroxy-3-polyprenylbenzoate decarboxylase
MPRFLVCLTGASGSAYCLRLLELLARSEAEIHFVASVWGERVAAEEGGRPLAEELAALGQGRLVVHEAADLSAPIASGSFRLDGTVILPASMGTIGALATGNVANLVHRAGAVALK